MKLKTLSAFTTVLFIVSLLVFQNENIRGTDLLAGSDYIKGLDINKVQKIALTFKGNKKIIFTRDSNKFLLENHKSYPADSSKVNDLIYKIASLQVKEKISSKADEEELNKYDLSENKRKFFVELFDNNGNRTVAFSVGKNHKKGNFLYKEGNDEVYLSENNVWINSSYKDFIDTALLKINKDQISEIQLKSDKEIKVSKEENDFIIKEPLNEKFKKEKVEEYANSFRNLRFNDFYAHTEPEVQALNFDKNVKIQLKNKLIYNMSLAKDDKNHFIKLNALIDEVPKQIVVNQNDTKEDLQNIEDMVKAQGDAHRLNVEKGAWVYKIDKLTYEKIVKESKFFM